jgi:predicted amidohydrolase
MRASTWSALQLSSQASVDDNLEAVRRLARRAVARGARVVVLPENFALMGDEADKREHAEPLPEPPSPLESLSGTKVARAVSELARELSIHVVAGGMPERSSDAERPFNTACVFDPTGALTARYRKVHLFDVELEAGGTYRESASTSAGDEPVVTELDGARVGLSICYDLRFPELYRALSSQGAEVLVVPAAFTLDTGKDHWEVLVRARAIEAQAFVVAAAQWGTHPRGRRTFGRSMIVDPWGTVLAQASEGEGLAVAELDPERLARVRKQLPALRHRRL